MKYVITMIVLSSGAMLCAMDHGSNATARQSSMSQIKKELNEYYERPSQWRCSEDGQSTLKHLQARIAYVEASQNWDHQLGRPMIDDRLRRLREAKEEATTESQADLDEQIERLERARTVAPNTHIASNGWTATAKKKAWWRD